MEAGLARQSAVWDRRLVQRLCALGFAEQTARETASTIRRLGHLPQIARRRSLAKDWAGRVDASQLREDGYIELTAALKPMLQPCLKALQEDLAERSDNPAGGGKSAKSFLVEMVTASRLERSPEILDFILCDQVIAYAIAYLGTVPVLQNIAFSWTPANESLAKSQLMHPDNVDSRQLKFSMNVTDVAPENGPFTFIPAPTSAEIISAWRKENPGYSHGQRIPDEFVERFVPEAEWMKAVGPAGTIYAVDTCRCLHCGARTRQGYRVTLRFNFTRRDSQRFAKLSLPGAVAARYEHDLVRRYIINL